MAISIERVGVGECYASFGELLQGVMPGRHKFLVNCRIRNCSRVTVRLFEPGYLAAKEIEIARNYSLYPKTCKGLRIFLGDLGRHEDCLVAIDSDIPVGKGLSSSTADMVAGVRALSSALSFKLKPDYVSRLLTAVEPNDGLHFDHTSAYCHTEGRLIANFDWVPPFHILGMDEGGVLDTVEFNRRSLSWNEAQMASYKRLLEDMQQALSRRDLPAVGALATESARRWQSVNPKKNLAAALELVSSLNALGVINTHSGTYLGLMFKDHPDLDRAGLERAVQRRLRGCELRWYATTGCAGVVAPSHQEAAASV